MILVTGATGNVGAELVTQLLEKGESLRVVTRDKKKVEHLDPRIERVIGDLDEVATIDCAVQGVDSLFLFPLIFDRTHKSNKLLLERAKQAGVKNVVMLSSMGAAVSGSELGELHRQKEVLVEQSGMNWTLVRPGMFMTNTFQWVPTIKGQGKVFNPAGDGKVAPISARDIAAVAATALTTSGHSGKAYELTGPELLSAKEQVDTLSQALNKPIQCVDIPVTAAAEEMRKSGAPEFLISSLSKMWEQVKTGRISIQNNTVEQITGKPGETFKQWCERNRNAFLN